MLRGVLRRTIRRDRPALRSASRPTRKSSVSSDDELMLRNPAVDDLVAFVKLSLRKIRPEAEEEQLQLEERNLAEERELREEELLAATKRVDLMEVEKRELIAGLSDWLERVVREAMWVEEALDHLEEPWRRLREIDVLVETLEKIPEKLTLSWETDN